MPSLAEDHLAKSWVVVEGWDLLFERYTSQIAFFGRKPDI